MGSYCPTSVCASAQPDRGTHCLLTVDTVYTVCIHNNFFCKVRLAFKFTKNYYSQIKSKMAFTNRSAWCYVINEMLHKAVKHLLFGICYMHTVIAVLRSVSFLQYRSQQPWRYVCFLHLLSSGRIVFFFFFVCLFFFFFVFFCLFLQLGLLFR